MKNEVFLERISTIISYMRSEPKPTKIELYDYVDNILHDAPSGVVKIIRMKALSGRVDYLEKLVNSVNAK